MPSNLKVAIVHDWLNQVGGAENVLEEMVRLFPTADIFTSIYAPEKMPVQYAQWPIHTSFMQRLPGITNRHQPYMPIYPLAFTQFDLAKYDVILSNKSGFCHGVKAGNHNGNGLLSTAQSNSKSPIHVCYCLTPTRFLWSFDQYQQREKINAFSNLLLRPLLAPLRAWDRNAAQKVNHFIAISREVQQRIKKFYGRESTIIYPPVDTNYFTPAQTNQTESALTPLSSLQSTAGLGAHQSVKLSESSDKSRNKVSVPSNPLNATVDQTKLGLNGNGHHRNDSLQNQEQPQLPLPDDVDLGNYFLIVSRLIPYKRIDLAVEAFSHLPNERLLIVGAGRDGSALQSLATDNVHFLGRLERSQIRELLRYCKAFIFTGLEDFGIAPVEAMSAGRPVIAYAGGGALDTVLPGVSGELFAEQTPDSLLSTLKAFNVDAYSTEKCRQQAERFSVDNFRNQLFQYIENAYESDR